MEQSLLGKLKRVRLNDLLHIFLFLIALPLSRILKMRRGHIWLMCDTRAEARDNAYWLFRYTRTCHPETDAVYAIDRSSPDYSRVSSYGEVIPYGTLKHWIYYLAAEKNISSQKMGKPNAAVCYVLEVYGLMKNKRYFLQHGIITADLSFLYYPHTKMSLFVTSTKAEYDYVNDHFQYPAGYVRELGLCRLDDLLEEHEYDEKCILIMPTWRMYIRNSMESAEEFRQTVYYRFWEGLLSSPEFRAFIDREDLKVIFYPHREMHRYLPEFTTDDPRITIASWPEYDIHDLLKQSAFLITDYSSVAMDFAFMGKPLIYYRFDEKQFYEEHHGVGYFDFEQDGFGPVCRTPEEVIDSLRASYRGGFRNDPKYMTRITSYFDLRDGRNCERNYQAIAEI